MASASEDVEAEVVSSDDAPSRLSLVPVSGGMKGCVGGVRE